MRDAEVSGAFAVDRRRVLKGLVRADDAVRATKEGVEKLEGLIDADVTSVHQDTPIAELFAPAAESAVPLAVVDDEGRLVGVVPRVTLLEAMAGEAVENGNVSTPEKSQQEAQEAQKGPAHDQPAGTTEGAPA